jgi:hypothetical protein
MMVWYLISGSHRHDRHHHSPNNDHDLGKAMTIQNNFTLHLGTFATKALTLTGADLTAANTVIESGRSLMVDEAIRKSLTAQIVMLGTQPIIDPQKTVQALFNVAANELAAAIPALLLSKPETVQALVQLGADKTSTLLVQWLGFAEHVGAALQVQNTDPALVTAFKNAAPNEALLKTFDDMKFETISGSVTMRGIDKQATMGAWVGETTLKGKAGAMKNWRFEDGAKYMFSEAEVRAARKA